MVLTRKRFSEEAILNILRQVELDLAAGSTVASAIRTAGISDATYYKWRKMYGGMGKSKLHEFKFGNDTLQPDISFMGAQYVLPHNRPEPRSLIPPGSAFSIHAPCHPSVKDNKLTSILHQEIAVRLPKLAKKRSPASPRTAFALPF